MSERLFQEMSAPVNQLHATETHKCVLALSYSRLPAPKDRSRTIRAAVDGDEEFCIDGLGRSWLSSGQGRRQGEQRQQQLCRVYAEEVAGGEGVGGHGAQSPADENDGKLRVVSYRGGEGGEGDVEGGVEVLGSWGSFVVASVMAITRQPLVP